MTHRVFSYGTLRQPDVQRGLYGRIVNTVPDALPGFRLDWVLITDPDVVALSGSDRHPILQAGDAGDSVDGAYLELDDAELEATDAYEVDDYERVRVVLASGVEAWVYAASVERTTETDETMVLSTPDILATGRSFSAAAPWDEWATGHSNARARMNALITLAYGAQSDAANQLDDEIANWTLPDVAHDLSAARWLVWNGFVKSAFSLVRSACDMTLASLYFHVRESEGAANGGDESDVGGWTRFFVEWDRGERDTPNWGEMKSYLETRAAYRSFVSDLPDLNPLVAAHALFKKLSGFTHGRAWTSDGEPASSMWIGVEWGAPNRDDALLHRFDELEAAAVELLAQCWLVQYPTALDAPGLDLSLLMTSPESAAIIEWARKQGGDSAGDRI